MVMSPNLSTQQCELRDKRRLTTYIRNITLSALEITWGDARKILNKALLPYMRSQLSAHWNIISLTMAMWLPMKISGNLSITTTQCDRLKPKDNPEAKVSHYCLEWEEWSASFSVNSWTLHSHTLTKLNTAFATINKQQSLLKTKIG